MEIIDEKDHRLAQFCQAFSNALRIKLVRLLLEGEKCVKTLTLEVKRSQSVVSRHLQKLASQDLVRSKSRGRRNYYQIKRPDLIDKLLELAELLQREDD